MATHEIAPHRKDPPRAHALQTWLFVFRPNSRALEVPMKRCRAVMLLFWVLVLGLIPLGAAEAADAVVGGACDEAAFDAALATVQASSGGKITFNCGTAPFYIYFSAEKQITKAVIIDGGNLAILSGNNSTRLFADSGSLTLKNTTVRNGNSNGQDGGAIYSTGTLVIDNSHLLYNTTGSEAVSGGAIRNSGPLTITNSELAYNTGGNAGAVYPRWSAAVTTITNSNFHDNQATNTTGSGWGGALLAWDGAPITITGSSFSYNVAQGAGGALYIYANSSLVMSDSTLSYNRSYDAGGGLYSAANSPVALSTSALSNNHAIRGGGMYVQGTSTITDTTVSGNFSASDGGGIWNAGVASLDRATVSGNDSENWGGGIWNSGTLGLSNSALVGNRVFRGGGIRAEGTTTLLNSTLASNQATYQYAYGGGVDAAGSVALNFTTLVDNTVNGHTQGLGASIYVGGSLTLKNSIVKSGPGACAGSGTLTSNGFNIATDGSCSLTQATDKQGIDPLLSTLAFHGGSTVNAVPLPGSPAIDHGQCGAVAADQRGILRPQGAACDVGAVERRPVEYVVGLFLPLVVR
jgi:predicted outer membrane repeat protein